MSLHFNWVPYFKGKLLTYYEYFALVGSTVAVLLAVICYIGYLFLKKQRKSKVKIDVQRGIVENKKGKLVLLEQILYIMTFVFLSLVPLICSSVTVLPTIGGIFGMMLILSVMVITNNHRTFREETKQTLGRMNWKITLGRSMIHNKKSLKQKLIIVAIVSIILPLFAHRTCLCFYNDEIGYYNHALGFGINTMFTRLFQLNKACPPGPPCHLYTTLPEDSITSVFVNLHTHVSVNNVTIHYQQIDSLNSSDAFSVQAKTYQYHGLDWNDQRNVHSALILGLKPSTKYLVRVFYDNKFWTNAIYKTLSDDPKVPIRMINAGDSGYTRPAIVLTKIIATLKPDVFFIGGDIAYDDNMPACAYTWDYYLKLYGSLTSTIGYLMPLVLTVGNHDVGLNQMPGINISINNYGPAYLIYFPQHFDRNGNFQIMKTIPPINRRRTFFYHTFSNFVYLSLDSGYVNTFHGFQKQFMINTLKGSKDKVKFANYHVPMYSGCKDFDIDPQTFVYGLFHWIPYFDMYKVMAVYENHVHSFKRTKPLKGSIPAENGTVYLGDGAFGAIPSQFCHPDRSIPIFETQFNQNNFWISVVDNQKVEHTAYNNSGAVIDYFVQDVSGYLRQ